MKLISPCCRVNVTALFIFKLRAASDLIDGFIKEYSALIDAKTLMSMYRSAVERPYGFLYVDLIRNEFYSSFISRFVVNHDTNSLGNDGGIE